MEIAEIKKQLNYDKKYTKLFECTVKDIDYFNGRATFSSETEELELGLTNWSKKQILKRLKVDVAVNAIESHFKDTKQKKLFGDGVERNKVIKDIIRLGIQNQKTRSKVIYDSNRKIARGVVYIGYNFISNYDVYESAKEIYGNDIDPRFSYITDTKMELFFELDMTKTAPISQEKVAFGISVGNSEVGDASLSVFQWLKFLRCENGLVLQEVKFGERLRHTRKELEKEFIKSMNVIMKDFSILDEIDKWYQRPDIIPSEALTDPEFMEESNKRIKRLLMNNGVHGKKHRQEIIKLVRERKEGVNGYKLGDAVNYYASNVVDNETVASQLIRSAYNIMQI